jgi:hypothetical protein
MINLVVLYHASRPGSVVSIMTEPQFGKWLTSGHMFPYSDRKEVAVPKADWDAEKIGVHNIKNYL